MCGIAGFYNFDGKPADPRVLLRMTDIQRHRGPDDQGLRLFSLKQGHSVEYDRDTIPPPSAGFEGGVGFNRLSILDLSPQGHQPMANESSTVFIAFNGEVYNANDHRPMLQANGYRFRSRTDTEVILYLYEEHGIDGCLEQLNGMFAFLIVDLRKGELHLARDRLGVKPLYVATHDRVLMFSSEIKSFRQHPAFRAELDPAHVDEYLTFRHCAGDRTLLRGVRQLRPGHRLRIEPDHVTEHRYWSIPDGPPRTDLSYADAVSHLENILLRGVQRQMISDVKTGCQLSGGIDSSLITLLAKLHVGRNIDAFSIVLNDPQFSEEPWIDAAAARANAAGHKFLLSEQNAINTLSIATWHMDQPISMPNAVGIYLLAQAAKPFCTVLLSGEGADELFGGYDRFCFAAARPGLLRWLPIVRKLPYAGIRFARAFGAGSDGDSIASFITSTAFVPPRRLAEIRPESRVRDVLAYRRGIFEDGRGSFLSNCLKYEMQTYMVDLLIRQDKMTMAHGVENRVPYLDNEIVDFVRTLPASYLVSPAWRNAPTRMRATKRLLKSLACRYFDDRFVYRRKGGFSLPLLHYYRTPDFLRWMNDELLPGMEKRGVVQANVVRKWWNAGQPSAWDVEQLWTCIAFEIWARLAIGPA